MVSVFFEFFWIFVLGTHFYRKQTKHTTPAANPVRTTRKNRILPQTLLNFSKCPWGDPASKVVGKNKTLTREVSSREDDKVNYKPKISI